MIRQRFIRMFSSCVKTKNDYFKPANIIVNGTKKFNSLLKLNSTYECKNLIIKNVNLTYSKNNNELIPVSCDSLYLIDCDKNFVYYWIKHFNINYNVMLFTHPCDPFVIQYLMKEKYNIYLSDRYYKYARSYSNYEKLYIVDINLETKIINYINKTCNLA